ncbi:putative N(G),N(G)-dimethylarginine dimethylaminohydrolase [Nitrospina gracilis 3/211]|uniref:Putative N(G),N(G)-dimethylarginine dimethylaminohydrolase n=1 Tax=Nitrospina gracilis (strain 3/211) TaxID=1266370 RepID=M1YJ88_NITG3|nr:MULTISPECIES: arginine deiminase family protein [Nitrospina]MCF8723500.1 dimethylargininase [Nitrospina sp. Nb-3]CCQ90571.1 putative N(G),N(G)-dimethylarginine dimethylaminohydrolase [Nitrospina gracilis 3/211]
MNTPLTALVRPPAATFLQALSRHKKQVPIDFPLSLRQHRFYVETLVSLGVKVDVLEPLDAFPDSTFIEDNAIILDDMALLTSMSATSRRGETLQLKAAMERHYKVEILEPPVFVDGGDVLQVGSKIFVGQSTRTNSLAVEAIAKFTRRPVVPIAVNGALHLKSAVSCLTGELLLIDPEKLDPAPFEDHSWIEVAHGESNAANCLTINGTVLMPSGYPETRALVEKRGLEVRAMPVSEFEKADGGLTCLSILIPKRT